MSEKKPEGPLTKKDLVKGYTFDSPGIGNHTFEITVVRGDDLTLQRDDGLIRFTNKQALVDTIGYAINERNLLNAKSTKN